MRQRLDSLTRSLIEYIKETAPKDQRFLDLSFDLNMNVFLLRHDRADMTCQQIFKRFCNIFAKKMKINQAIFVLSHDPLVKREVTYWNCSRKNCCDTNVCFDQPHLHFPQYRQIKNKDNSSDEQNQYLFCLPIVTEKNLHNIEWGFISFQTQEVDGIIKNAKSLRLFSIFLANRLVRFYHAKVIKYLNSAKRLPSREIKQIIRTTLLGMSKTLSCDYSIGLALNRSYSEAKGTKGEPKQTFEVVTEYLIGKKSSTPQKSLSTGLWIEEDEGLISAVISLWRKDKPLAQQGLTFHKIENSQSRYYCLELEKEFSSLQGYAGESAEKTIFYTALVNEDILLGFIKLSYREKIVYGDFERSLATQYCRFLAVRIRNSFIYSLNIDQSRFLFEIKALFEKADRLKIQNFEDISYIFKKLSELIVDITGIETISIGYISKNSNGEKVIHFPHPIGWSKEACQRFKEISIQTGLAGLAVRIKRRIYLAPVEKPLDSSGPIPSVYVNEQESYFIDIRKHPELVGRPGYKQLSSYYEKVNDEKVYADHVFLIEYKKIVLGVIDVEVTRKNWDRFIGIGYLHFFQTLANMLALLFYRVRLVEEHNRVVNAVKWLSDAVFMSPQAVIKSILGMLRSIYNVPKAKIILCDIYKNPIEINPFVGKFEYMFLGYHPSVVKKLTSAASIIDKDNFFLNELKCHIERKNTFFKYIQNIKKYKPQEAQKVDKLKRFKKNPHFRSYMGIVLGDKNKSLGVLELVSENKNAFDDLLIDQAFFETWVSQITMAMKYTSEDKKSGAVKAKRLHLPYIQRNNVIPLLPVEKIESEFGFVGSGESIFQLRDYIRKTSNMSSGPILLSGESGSGKELVARAIHKVGERANNSFIACDCGTFGELVDDRMFGHLKGAYTGATEASNGLFEEADNGVLFLDEISNLSLSVQPNFLRVLEDYSFAKIGSSKTICVNVFVIAATNQNLKAMVDRGDFRADLYYRLEAISINTVPLRQLVLEDKNNLLQLVSYFVHIDHSNINGIQGISTSSYEALLSYDFEGNVRELRNIIKKAIFCLDKDGILNFSINSDKQDFDDSNKIMALLRRLSKKYSRKDIPAFVERAALNVILSLLNETLTPEEGISRFTEKIGPIDIPIAMLFTQRGETWTRKILNPSLPLRPLSSLKTIASYLNGTLRIYQVSVRFFPSG